MREITPCRALFSLLCGVLVALIAGAIMALVFNLPDHVALVSRYIVIGIAYQITNSTTIISVLSVIFIDRFTIQGIALTQLSTIRLFLKFSWKSLAIVIALNIICLFMASKWFPSSYMVYIALILMTTFGTYNVFHACYVQTKIFQQYIPNNRKKKASMHKWIRLVGVTMIITAFGVAYFSLVIERVQIWAATSSYRTGWAIFGCFGVKLTANYFLRKIFMRHPTHPHTVFFMFSASITLIGTPMRLLCNYLLDNGNAISAVLILGLIEIIIRLGLIGKVALTAKYRLKSVSVQSSVKMKSFVNWKKRRFFVLEAENFAEMLSEYMSICLSICIYAAIKRQVTMPMVMFGLIQIAVEIVVDWCCLTIEQRLGMPIASVIQGKKGFLTVLCTNAVLGIVVATIPMYLATKTIFLELEEAGLSSS